MTVRFNPPPGWPAPPASWLPGDDWLPDPAWPPPPADWSWWTVTARPATAPGPQPLGRLGRPSFPVATRAAQSTVSLAALFPERAREGASYGAAPSGYAAGSAPAPGVRTKAGREYYRPASERAESRAESLLDDSAPHHLAAGALDEREIAHAAADVAAASSAAAAGSPGIRLSPLLRLVGDGSGVRAQFAVGGPAAAAISDVLAPAVEAAVGAAVGRSGRAADSSSAATPPRGRRGFFRRRRDRSDAGPGDVAAGRPAGLGRAVWSARLPESTSRR